MKLNYNYIDPEVTDATVKTLMQGIIANGDIFENVPAALKSAKLVTTSETAVDLS